MSEYTEWRSDRFAAEAFLASRDCAEDETEYDPEPELLPEWACEECDGTGEIGTDICPTCEGTGRKEKE